MKARYGDSVVRDEDMVDESRWFRQHAWPLVGILTILISGMAFTLWWNPLVHHVSSWHQAPDLWLTFRTSQYVAWGFEGEIYKAQTFFVTFPGIAVLLAPVAKISGIWHMSESFPIFLQKPTSLLILNPVNLFLGGVLLFPLNSLARRLLIPSRRRMMLVWMEVVLIWPTVEIWGHPEYTVALAFGVYGLMAAFDGVWIRAGLFFGIAMLFQPLTLLVVPVVLAYLPMRRWIPFACEIAFPSALLLIAPLVKEWRATTHVLLRQPNYPTADHPTPWVSLAPVLQRSHSGAVVAVSAGPGRLFAIALACAIGLWVARSRPSLTYVVWWAACAFSLRCVFECVMNPYYLMPGILLLLIVSSTLGSVRWFFTIAAASASAYLSYRVMSPWHYYLVTTGFLLVAISLAWPNRSSLNLRADERSRKAWIPLTASDDAIDISE